VIRQDTTSKHDAHLDDSAESQCSGGRNQGVRRSLGIVWKKGQISNIKLSSWVPGRRGLLNISRWEGKPPLLRSLPCARGRVNPLHRLRLWLRWVPAAHPFWVNASPRRSGISPLDRAGPGVAIVRNNLR